MDREVALPIVERDARALRVGDVLHVTGRLFTARDQAHRLMLGLHRRGERLPFDPARSAVFHCGPLVRRGRTGYDVLAAGPTTSGRMEKMQAAFLEAFRPGLVIGKGGMGERTQDALRSVGAAYAHFTGGAGALAAERIVGVADVFWLEELGSPEAVWLLDVKRFGPLHVTMDSIGGNLYRDVGRDVAARREEILARIDGTPAGEP